MRSVRPSRCTTLTERSESWSNSQGCSHEGLEAWLTPGTVDTAVITVAVAWLQIACRVGDCHFFGMPIEGILSVKYTKTRNKLRQHFPLECIVCFATYCIITSQEILRDGYPPNHVRWGCRHRLHEDIVTFRIIRKTRCNFFCTVIAKFQVPLIVYQMFRL